MCQYTRFGKYLSENDGITLIKLKLKVIYGSYAEPEDRFFCSVKKSYLS